MSWFIEIVKKKKKKRRNNLIDADCIKNNFWIQIQEIALNEDTDTEFLFAWLKPEGANWRCRNLSFIKN